MLDLTVVDFMGAARWRWRLSDHDGSSLVSGQDVVLDPGSADFQLASDLYRHQWLLDTDPRLRRSSTRDLLRRAGSYLATTVLGEAGRLIAARAPVTVRVALPQEAVGLLTMPLELADFGDGPLAQHGVVLCYAPAPASADVAGAGPGRGSAPGASDGRSTGGLRMLGIFALPETSSALGLVRERRTLVRVAHDDPVARGTEPADLRIVQYGATRDAVQQALGEAPGWDAIHLAGHGKPGRLYMEGPDGRPDPVEAAELLRWLAPCAGRTRLVVLSACESGIARVARVASASSRRSRVPVSGGATALGYEIARALDCTVLATRYPVDDRFTLAFTPLWYEALLRDGASVDDAFRAAIPAAVKSARGAPLSPVTPILLGAPATRLELPRAHPAGSLAKPTAARRSATMSGVPGEIGGFTGQTTLLARIGAILAPDSGASGLVVTGMPGIGKTAVMTEAARRFGGTFRAVTWHRATRRDTARSLAAALAGSAHTPAVPRSAADPHTTARAIRSRHALLVIDEADSLLAHDGAWRDGLGDLITALLDPGARSRTVLIAHRPLPGLPLLAPSLGVRMLSRSESEWLARELHESWQEAASSAEDGEDEGDGRASPEGLPWLVCRGHPGLIGHCGTGGSRQVTLRTRRIDRAWEVTTPLAPDVARARRPLGARHPGARIANWASERAATLPPAAQRALCFLASIEQPDRTPGRTSFVWSMLAADTKVDAGPLDEALAPAEIVGLAERSPQGTYLLHPAIAAAARALDPQVHDRTIRYLYVIWDARYQEEMAKPRPSQETAAHCTASAVPYLMRLGLWESASEACERAIVHDGSPEMAGRLAPYNTQVARAALGTPLELKATLVRAAIIRHLDESRSLAILTRLYDRAAHAGDEPVALVAASSAATLLAGKDPVQARDFLQRAQDISAAAQEPPWARVRLRNIEAEIRHNLSDWAGALAEAQGAIGLLDQAAAAGVPLPGINQHAERTAALAFAAAAARALGERERAQDYRGQLAALDQSSAQRAAAQSQFNEISELIRQGRLGQARDLLLAALATFTGPGDTGDQGLVLIRLAQVEHRAGHHDDAVALGRRALRASYSAGERLDAAEAHASMANFLAATSAAAEAPSHLLAAAVIHVRMLNELLAWMRDPRTPAARSLSRLAYCLARKPLDMPQTLDQLRHALDESTAVDLEGLLAGLDRVAITMQPGSGKMIFTRVPPSDSEPPGDSLTDTLCWATNNPPLEQLTDLPGHPSYWQPLIDAVAAAVSDPSARAELWDGLDNLRGCGWGVLASDLERLMTDGAAFRPSPTLTDAEHGIVERAMAAAEPHAPSA